MIRSDRHTWQGMAAMGLMFLVLAILAVLQYRWFGEISRAEQARLQWALGNAVGQFRLEFNSELRRICSAFQVSPSTSSDAVRRLFLERFREWRAEDHGIDLLVAVYLRVRSQSGEASLLKLDPKTGDWESVAWTPEFERVRKVSATVGTQRTSPWRVIPEMPALIHAVRFVEGFSGDADLVILELSPAKLNGELLPALTKKHFGRETSPVFEVAVTLASGSPPVYYSNPGSSTEWFARPDSRNPLVWDRPEPGASQRGTDAGRNAPQGPAAATLFPVARILRPLMSEGPGWELLVRYHAGSLETAVRNSRLRNFVIGFGVLLLLAAGTSVLLLAARRAQRLAQLQVRFVAGISHDLRTPLAVINSAADNLAVGVVDDAGPRAREYGSVIRGECRKLASMIEQILCYANQEGHSRPLAREAVSVEDVVRDALNEAGPLLQTERFEVSSRIMRPLPAVIADRSALLQVLRNLLDNVVRHAAAARWIGVVVERAFASGKDFVEIRIEDRGPGIDAVDMPHIFKPFYRGRGAQRAGTRGSGLGLSLARERVVSMRGTIRAVNTHPGGVAFIVQLPVPDEEIPAAAGSGEEGGAS